MCTSMLWLIAGVPRRRPPHPRCSPQPGTRGYSRTGGARPSDLAKVFRLLQLLPADEVEQVTSEDGWFRFCLTRHPVERLWSSWQSKLLLREPDFLGWYGTAQWFPRAPKELPGTRLARDARPETAQRHPAAGHTHPRYEAAATDRENLCRRHGIPRRRRLQSAPCGRRLRAFGTSRPYNPVRAHPSAGLRPVLQL